ncbi:MAG: hypothetical protein WDZ82_02735 [Candidatus Paceibacterota bacterium]
MKKFLKEQCFLQMVISSLFMLLVVPGVVRASSHLEVETMLENVIGIIETLIQVSFVLILVAFFWGLARYVFNAGSEASIQQGKRIMTGGVIALTVASLIWGIITWVRVELGISDTSTIEIIEGPGGSGA